MPAEHISIHPQNPEPRKIAKVVEAFQAGKTVIYPTDTVYGIGCSISDSKAIEKIARIRGLKPEKAFFSIMCYDLSHLSEFAKLPDQAAFRLMKRALPGPYTFILPIGNKVPRALIQTKRTIGLRISAHPIPLEIIRLLDSPILTASLRNDDDINEYPTEPEDIYEQFKNSVDLIIDAGAGNMTPSTIIDITSGQPVIIREGAGDITILD
jgi:tRNA threonylcarbamoyl adenosine modification protein (Sua5/YciO/YrdC/YwlC family)